MAFWWKFVLQLACNFMSQDSLYSIPGFGKASVRDLNNLGIYKVEELINRSPEDMYVELEKVRKAHVDRCVLCAHWAGGASTYRFVCAYTIHFFELPLNSLEATKRTHRTPKQLARANASGLCIGGCVVRGVQSSTKHG